MSEMLLSFVTPFFHSLQQRGLSVTVDESTQVPLWLCTDWKVYLETLFHIFQNAIKFNADQGTIRLRVAFAKLSELPQCAVDNEDDDAHAGDERVCVDGAGYEDDDDPMSFGGRALRSDRDVEILAKVWRR